MQYESCLKYNHLSIHPFTPSILTVMGQQQTAFGNLMRKGEIARNEQFLLFPQCFLLNQIILSQVFHIFDIISLFAAEFEERKIDISGKGFKLTNRVSLNTLQLSKKVDLIEI